MDVGGVDDQEVQESEWCPGSDASHSRSRNSDDERYNLRNASTKRGGKSGQFNRFCHHCGEWRHRDTHCPRKSGCRPCGDLGNRASQCRCTGSEVRGRSRVLGARMLSIAVGFRKEEKLDLVSERKRQTKGYMCGILGKRRGSCWCSSWNPKCRNPIEVNNRFQALACA